VKFRKTLNGDDLASNENLDVVTGANNNQEEAKVSKTGGKRGRPRKNPLNVKDDSSNQKSKRGRKPKKFYDIDPSENKFGGNVIFNDSENNDKVSEYSDNNMHKNNDSPALGPIANNMRLMDNHNFSFDSIAYQGKNDNYPSSSLPFYPRKESMNNPYDKYEKHNKLDKF